MSRRRKKRSSPRRTPVLDFLHSRATLFHLVTLSALSFVLYARTLRYGFVADDQFEILKDPLIRSFARIPALFAHGVWFFERERADNYYRPLKLLAYSVEYHLFDFHAALWHLVNIVLNVGVVLAIYFLVRDLASDQPSIVKATEGKTAYAPLWRSTAGGLAFWSALFFAFHPIHVEAVAWIAAGSDLLCGLALLLALWFYHRARVAGLGEARAGVAAPPVPRGGGTAAAKAGPYSASVALFFAGLLFKETALTFPGIIVSYDFFYRGETMGEVVRGWRRYLAYAVALGGYLVLRLHALSGFAPRTNPLSMTFKDMVLSVPVLAVEYVWKALVPTNLNFWHVYEPTRALGWKPIAAIALVLVLVLAMFWLRPVPSGTGLRSPDSSGRGPDVEREQGVFESGRGRQPLLSFALAWFWLTLIPVLDIPHVNPNVFTERYLYIPTFGVCILAAWAWLWLRERAPGQGEQARGGEPSYAKATAGRLATSACLLALLTCYSAIIFRRLPYWHDDLLLLTRTAQQVPDAGSVQCNLGIVDLRHGLRQEALEHVKRAVALEPANPFYHDNLGTVFLMNGRDDEALREVQEAIRIRPTVPTYWANLALVYQAKKDWAKSIEACKRGLALEPNFRPLLDAFGLALWNFGQRDEALSAYRRAIQVDPDDMNAYLNLAEILAQLGQLDAATNELLAALRANPESPQAYLVHFELGMQAERKGLWQEAAGQFQRTVGMKPDFAPARTQLEAARAHLANPQP